MSLFLRKVAIITGASLLLLQLPLRLQLLPKRPLSIYQPTN